MQESGGVKGENALCDVVSEITKGILGALGA